MRCEEVQDALALGRDPAHALGAAGREHLEGCGDCRAALAAEAALCRVLAADVDTEPRPGFDTRFFARLAERKARRRRVRWMLGGLALPALAAAAVALVLFRGEDAKSDLELAMNLDLVEDLELLGRLDEVEAFVDLRDVDEAEIEAVRGPR